MERNSGDIPGTVLAMLQARISRLSVRARPTRRAASVFGQTFTKQGVQRLLTATHSADAINAELELEGRVREEIVEPKRERRGTPGGEYAFRHALVRDAAYALVSDEEATV